MYEFALPDLGEGIHEGEILKWHVNAGDYVALDAPLVDVETDKAAVTIPSPKAARVVEIRAAVGDTVRVGQVLVVLDVERGGAAEPVARPEPPPRQPPASGPQPEPAKSGPPAGPVPASPATRRLARELGVDLREVPASGPGGRVTSEDVRRFVAAGRAGPAAESPEESAPGAAASAGVAIPFLDLQPLPDFAQWGEVEREPLRSIRRKVARNTVTAMVVIPHVAHMDEADVTDLEAFRREENARRERDGVADRLTLLAFVVRAVTKALRRHPVFNATLDPFRGEIVFKKYFNVGIAVDTDRGLIVPNLKGADRLGVDAVARGIADLAARARQGTIGVADLQGGTFTITNIGVLGGTSFVPAIHYPESAILGMGRAAPRPVARDGQVVIRTMLPLVLSFDHRIADGAEAARFVGLVRDFLERPLTLLLEG